MKITILKRGKKLMLGLPQREQHRDDLQEHK